MKLRVYLNNLNLRIRFYNRLMQTDRNLRIALFMILYAFMNVATKLTIEDRVALNPLYPLFLTIGFIFSVLFGCGVLVKYYTDKNSKEVLKKYGVSVIS